jgi:hypothetical protein
MVGAVTMFELYLRRQAARERILRRRRRCPLARRYMLVSEAEIARELGRQR